MAEEKSTSTEKFIALSRWPRWILALAVLACVSYLAVNDELSICEDATEAVGDPTEAVTVEQCRAPTITDLSVLAPGVLIALLLLPEVQFGFGGVTIKRQVAKAEQAVEQLRAEVRASASSNSTAISKVVISPDSKPGSQRDRQVWTWISALVQIQMDRLRVELKKQLAGADSPLQIQIRVYQFASDRSLFPMFTSYEPPPGADSDQSAPRIPQEILIFEPGTGVVGFAARTRAFYSVLGAREIQDQDDKFRLRRDQRTYLAQAAEQGQLPAVIAAVPLLDEESLASIGAVTVDVFGDHLPDIERKSLDDRLLAAMTDPAVEIGDVLAGLGSVS